MDQENGEYMTVADNFLEGYKGKVYKQAGENPNSYTETKIVFENGKVVSYKDSEKNNEDESKNTITGIESKDDNIILPDNNTMNIIDTKLPQTGEEDSLIVRYLSSVIILGIVWLGSMLLIDREKKKMEKR